MSALTTDVSVTLDYETKEKADAILSEFGISMSTLFGTFLEQIVQTGRIPFEAALANRPLMRSEIDDETFDAMLRLSREQHRAGKSVSLDEAYERLLGSPRR